MSLIGEKIREVRINSGVSIVDLSRLLLKKYRYRASQPYISTIEIGRVIPSGKFLQLISEVFDVDIDGLCSLVVKDRKKKFYEKNDKWASKLKSEK